MGSHSSPDTGTGLPVQRAEPATGPIPVPVPFRLPARPSTVNVTATAATPTLDGANGNLLARTEPKVRAASLAALLTPIALFYGHRYLPGGEELPQYVALSVDAVITGAVAWVAGFAAKAVDRLDLFADPQ